MTFRHEEWLQMQDRRDRRSGTSLFVLHTCGSTIVVNAIEKGIDPNRYVPDWYDNPGADGPHEVITWEGAYEHPEYGAPMFGQMIMNSAPDSWQIADPNDAAPHAGIGGGALALYAKGLPTWTRYLYEDSDHDGDKELVEYQTTRDRYRFWTERWKGKQSPLDLLPQGTRNPNDCSYAWEIVQPVAQKPGGGWTTVPFTERQHDVAAFRVAQRMVDFQFAYTRERAREAVVGHGDVHPLTRYAPYGEWDIGGRGTRLLWNWELFFGRLDYWAGCAA